ERANHGSDFEGSRRRPACAINRDQFTVEPKAPTAAIEDFSDRSNAIANAPSPLWQVLTKFAKKADRLRLELDIDCKNAVAKLAMPCPQRGKRLLGRIAKTAHCQQLIEQTAEFLGEKFDPARVGLEPCGSIAG